MSVERQTSPERGKGKSIFYAKRTHFENKTKNNKAMSDVVRTRFAPSPTGYMHIGNLRTALFAFLYARSQGGRFILRIEDTDQGRYVEGATDIIYDTLRTAGLHHDEGPDVGGDFGPYVQSQRKDMYRKYAEELVAKGEAYYCFCRRDDKEAESSEGYNRHCRSLSAGQVKEQLAQGKPYVIRQRIPLEGTTSWDDLVYGTISVDNRTLDDQILLKSDGMPTYNFANVIDDHLMGITHIIRGSEYLSSNPKYILLYQAFGWEMPRYIHLPLINGQNPDGTISKLSKRHGAVSFQALVEDGYLPEAIINYIALLGWSPKSEQEIFSLDELVKLFSVTGVHKSPAVFDYKKLDWVNSQHIVMMSDEEFADKARPYAGIDSTPLEDKWTKIASLLKPRVNKLSEVAEKTAFLKQLGAYDTEMYINKKNKSTFESSIRIIENVIGALDAEEQWNEEALYNTLSSLAQSLGIKEGQLFWPVRIALSGLMATPGNATDILFILGKEESVSRLKKGVEMLKKASLA